MLRFNHTYSKTMQLTCFMAAFLMASPALADTIRGSLNGEEHSWHVLKQGSASTASFSELVPGMHTVRLQGHIDDEFATKGTLSISFTLMGGEMISPPEVAYFHTNKFIPNYGNQDTPALWELSTSEVEGDTGHFAGRYEGTLKLQGDPEGDEPETLEVSVEFDVKARKDNL